MKEIYGKLNKKKIYLGAIFFEKNHIVNFKKIVKHLCKNHKLVDKQNSYVLYGLSIGVLISSLLNILIGIYIGYGNTISIIVICLGMIFGTLIGLKVDSSNKKKSKII